MKSFQDFYPDDFAICYGCGRLNEHGLQIKSYWDGDESICTFEPKRERMVNMKQMKLFGFLTLVLMVLSGLTVSFS